MRNISKPDNLSIPPPTLTQQNLIWHTSSTFLTIAPQLQTALASVVANEVRTETFRACNSKADIYRFPSQVFIEDVPRTPVSWKNRQGKEGILVPDVRFRRRSNPFYFQLAMAAERGLTFHDAIFTQLFIASLSRTWRNKFVRWMVDFLRFFVFAMQLYERQEVLYMWEARELVGFRGAKRLTRSGVVVAYLRRGSWEVYGRSC